MADRLYTPDSERPNHSVHLMTFSINDLPNDVLSQILVNCGRTGLRRVCKQWDESILSNLVPVFNQIEGAARALWVAVQYPAINVRILQAVWDQAAAPLVFSYSYSPLVAAACCGNAEIVQWLLDSGVACDSRSIAAAAGNGHGPVLAVLLRHDQEREREREQPGQKFNPEKYNKALVCAASGGHADVVELLLRWPVNAPHANGQCGEALIEAAAHGHVLVVELLLRWPVNAPHANCRHDRALVEAAAHGHVVVVELLLEWPKHKHAPRPRSSNYEQALIDAAGSGYAAVVELLLQKWPNVPLIHAEREAKRNGRMAVMELLAGWRASDASDALSD